MRLTRRDALRAVVATGVGVASAARRLRRRCTSGTGCVRVDAEIPVSGLPPALDGLRVGLITDIHHSATVSADDIARAGRDACTRRSPISSCSAATT